MATVPQSPSEVFYPGRKLPPAMPLTEQEFLAWCDEDTRAEWVEGDVILLSPANVNWGCGRSVIPNATKDRRGRGPELLRVRLPTPRLRTTYTETTHQNSCEFGYDQSGTDSPQVLVGGDQRRDQVLVR